MPRFMLCLNQFSDPVNCARSAVVNVAVAMLVPSMPHHPTKRGRSQGAHFLLCLTMPRMLPQLSACACRLKTGDGFGLTRPLSHSHHRNKSAGGSDSRFALDGCFSFSFGFTTWLGPSDLSAGLALRVVRSG